MKFSTRKLIPTLFAAVLFALVLPLTASAQDPWWGRDNRRNDDWRGRNGGYEMRQLRESVRRLQNRADNFQRNLDSALDHSRFDDTRREDRLNEVARDFRRAIDQLRNRISDDYGRDYGRGSDYGRGYNLRGESEARRVLQIGSRLDRVMGRNRFDRRVESDWAQIRQDLLVIANTFNLRFGHGGRDYGYGRGRDDYDYGRRFPY